MVDWNTAKINVLVAGERIARRVLGSDFTGILATLAEGLFKVGNISVDAKGPGTTHVNIRNSTVGQVADLNVEGNVDSQGAVSFKNNGAGNYVKFSGTPTGGRTVTFPDVTGDALVRDTTNGVVPLAGDTLFDAPDSGADTSVGFLNSEAAHVCNVVADGTVQFLTDLGSGAGFRFAGTPTALRTITVPDADITLGGGSSSIPVATKAGIMALPVPAAPVIYLCSDIGGIAGGGVMGALVYYNTVTGMWLRISNDSNFLP